MTEPIILNNQQFLIWLACIARAPTKEAIDFEIRRDNGLNPHNDSHKPRIRSELEIECDLRLKFVTVLQNRTISGEFA